MGVALKDRDREGWVFESVEAFSDSLGALGAWVGPRVGKDRRTKAQKEEYCLRRFLVALKRTNRLSFPASVQCPAPGKGPDFVLVEADRERFGLEITEAGDEAHQARLTASEGDAELYAHGISESEIADSILAAIEKKRDPKKLAQYHADGPCELLVYDNTRSGGFVDMWNVATSLAEPKGLRLEFRRVHVLSGATLYYDAFGNERAAIALSADYDIDFAGWVRDQVERLRHVEGEGLDIPHVIEELEGLAKRDKRAFRSELVRLIAHLLKWRYQASRRSKSWLLTIEDARTKLDDLIVDNPSFANEEFLRDELTSAYARARRRAAIQMRVEPADLPEDLPFGRGEIFDEDFLPAEPPKPDRGE